MENIFFYLGLSFLIVHEMDAVRCREWRILPGLSSLGNKTGLIVFLVAHIPLLVWIIMELNQNPINKMFIKCFDIFMIVHVGLHVLFLRHKNNEFNDWISWVFIIGAGIFGLLDLLKLLI